MDFVAPYALISKYKGLAAETKLGRIKNKKGDEVKNTTSPVWWSLAIETRTFFEQGSSL